MVWEREKEIGCKKKTRKKEKTKSAKQPSERT